MANQDKTALVLAGGGLTGAVYEIGALRAIDDLLIDRTVNDFDIYVGTSAGAMVSAMLANGLSPEIMLAALEGSESEYYPLRRRDIFGVNLSDSLKWGLNIPKRLLEAWANYLLNFNDMTFFDLVWSLSEVLPPGLYNGLALDQYIRRVLENGQRTNQFNTLKRELYIIATDLDSGERAIFGTKYQTDVPISLAVAASSAVPLLYRPVRINERDYVDGGLRGNASIDLAIEQGAKLVVCINPMVPFDSRGVNQLSIHGEGDIHLSDIGVQSIATQTLRITTHAGLQYHVKQLRRAHPEVDIILIEPNPEDHQMFFNNIMNYSARLTVARHGFESATLDLAQDYQTYKQILARHNIPITRRLVIEEITEIQASGNDPEVIRKVLEARSRGCGRSRMDTPICQLTRTLATLELALDQISASQMQ